MSQPPNSQTPSRSQNQSQSQSASVPNDLAYGSLTRQLDSTRDASGSLKPEWASLLGNFESLGIEALRQRELKAGRILRDDGATYNISGSPDSPSGNWELDTVPHVIGSEDWANIEAGLIERSELFNLILRDVYGPRDLIRHGAIPPEVLFSHGGFLRACHGIKMPGEHELIIHAVDLVRRPDGSMCALSDRTKAPSGAAYALENRTVMSRVFPGIYRNSNVHRIASFYHQLRHKLSTLSPSGAAPRIALLTSGAQNETYFEHAYLANHLGFPLVQSGDLIVRNGSLWIKSLEGLKRVDVLLRQVDDEYCDPVELRSDSHMGVPGLLEVVRTGRLVVANPLGSGVLENAALLKYLPQVSNMLLGREPRLATIKTYWCGDDADLAHVTENIRSLIIKPSCRSAGQNSIWGGGLSEDQLAALLAKIHKHRYLYVAQERFDKPLIPAFTGTSLEPRPSLLRTFSVATDTSYMVLPGGLTRIGAATDSQIFSMQSGSPSKDTWITASEPERKAQPDKPLETQRTGPKSPLVSLPSRVVENLYWMGRYAERAEASMRLLRTVFVLLNGEDTISLESRRVLLQTVSEVTTTLPGFVDASDEVLADPDEELLQVIRDGNRVGSVRSTLNSMLLCADESRELLSTDTIRIINDLRDALNNLDSDLAGGLASAPEEALDPLVTSLAGLAGLMQESMIRGMGWRFMELGKRIERSMQSINMVKSLMTPVPTQSEQAILLTALLTSNEALITYRRRGRERRGIELGLELVLLDDSNPRSLIFQLDLLQRHLAKLPKNSKDKSEFSEEARALLEASTALKLSRMSELLKSRDGRRLEIESLMTRLTGLLTDFSRLISDRHFDHRSAPQQLVNTIRGER